MCGYGYHVSDFCASRFPSRVEDTYSLDTVKKFGYIERLTFSNPKIAKEFKHTKDTHSIYFSFLLGNF